MRRPSHILENAKTRLKAARSKSAQKQADFYATFANEARAEGRTDALRLLEIARERLSTDPLAPAMSISFPAVTPDTEEEYDVSGMETVFMPIIPPSPYITAPLPRLESDHDDAYVRYAMDPQEYTFAQLVYDIRLLKNALVWYCTTYEEVPVSVQMSFIMHNWLTLLCHGEVFHYGNYSVPMRCDMAREGRMHIEHHEVYLERPQKTRG